MAEAFVTCSLVWDVATALAHHAEQDAEAPFFRERAEESRLAAVTMDREAAQRFLEEQRRDVLPELRILALSDPQHFVNGPYRQCAELANRTAAVAARAGKSGASGVEIR